MVKFQMENYDSVNGYSIVTVRPENSDVLVEFRGGMPVGEEQFSRAYTDGELVMARFCNAEGNAMSDFMQVTPQHMVMANVASRSVSPRLAYGV